MSDREIKDIKRIIVHCSATSPRMNIGAAEIDQWHRDRGWAGIGYHFVIRRDGLAEAGRPIGQAGAHARGHNADTIAICLVGGTTRTGEPEANFTFSQYRRLNVLVTELVASYPEIKFTANNILGHCDLMGVDKACPCFSVRDFFGFTPYA